MVIQMKHQVGQKIYTGVTVLLIILVYIQIYLFSGMPEAASGAQSMTVTEQLVAFFEECFSLSLPYNDSPEQIDKLDGVVRKMAHFTEYALLGILTYSIVICWDKQQRKGTVGSFLFVTVLAALDEFHQTFVPGRWGSPRDVLLDSAGCITGMALLWLASARYRRRIKRV